MGNYLSSGDSIIVHMCGVVKEVNIKKSHEYLGLTITDNGHGRSFIKKLSPNEDIDAELIKPGDHIAAINGSSTVGLRHYEVARAIRDVPQHFNFVMQLIEPVHLENYLSLDKNDDGIKSKLDLRNDDNPLVSFTLNDYQYDRKSNMDSYQEDLANSSLPIDQLLSKGSNPKVATELFDNSSYRVIIDKINSILESFLGINDNALAIQIYRIAKENKNSYDDFIKAIRTSELSVFNFGENIETYLWNCVT